jgi:formylmethanofuran dehydrogenase subunit E
MTQIAREADDKYVLIECEPCGTKWITKRVSLNEGRSFCPTCGNADQFHFTVKRLPAEFTLS